MCLVMATCCQSAQKKTGINLCEREICLLSQFDSISWVKSCGIFAFISRNTVDVSSSNGIWKFILLLALILWKMSILFEFIFIFLKSISVKEFNKQQWWRCEEWEDKKKRKNIQVQALQSSIFMKQQLHTYSKSIDVSRKLRHSVASWH